MKSAAFLALMLAQFPIRTSGQELVGTLSLTTEAGYLTNTYLHPVLPLWVAADAPFVGLEPTASLAWMGDRTYAAVEGRLRMIELTDRGGVWWMAGSQARIYRRLHRALGAGIDGSAGRIQMGVRQWLAWGAPYVTMQIANRLQLTARFGVSFRRYDAVDSLPGFDQHSTFALAQLSVLTTRRWDLNGHVYASQSASGASDAAGVGSTASYGWTRDLSLGMDVAAEWFGSGSWIRQAAAFLEWEPSRSAAWSARFGMQRFGTDSSVDVFAAIGFTYRLQHRRDVHPSPLAWTRQGEEIVLRYRYEDGGTLYLVGDFNDWKVGETVLHHDSGNVYTARLSLPPGAYEYKLIAVEGGSRQWLPLPEEALTTDDEFGSTNGILLVE